LYTLEATSFSPGIYAECSNGKRSNRGSHITEEGFFKAARKGQGRALSALRAHEFEPSRHNLYRLILRWPGYDAQCESSREWYTAELLEATSYMSELIPRLLQLMGRTKGSWRDRSHREALALELAKRGNEEVRSSIYANFDCDGDLRYADEIVALEGLGGLDWLLARVDPEFMIEEAWRFDGWLEDATAIDGESAVISWKEHAVKSNPLVSRVLEPANRPIQPTNVVPQTASYEEMRATSQSSSSKSWVRRAADDEIRKAWRAFEKEKDPIWVRKLGLGLECRPDLCDPGPIIRRALSWDQEPNYFGASLSGLDDPRIRALGLELVARGQVSSGTWTLRSSVTAGDVPLLIEAASRVADDNDLHHIGLDFLHYQTVQSEEILNWVYENTPCSFCRNSAVRDMLKHGFETESILDECLLDCDPDTRQLAADALGA
jgi:hypothetical protein